MMNSRSTSKRSFRSLSLALSSPRLLTDNEKVSVLSRGCTDSKPKGPELLSSYGTIGEAKRIIKRSLEPYSFPVLDCLYHPQKKGRLRVRRPKPRPCKLTIQDKKVFILEPSRHGGGKCCGGTKTNADGGSNGKLRSEVFFEPANMNNIEVGVLRDDKRDLFPNSLTVPCTLVITSRELTKPHSTKSALPTRNVAHTFYAADVDEAKAWRDAYLEKNNPSVDSYGLAVESDNHDYESTRGETRSDQHLVNTEGASQAAAVIVKSCYNMAVGSMAGAIRGVLLSSATNSKLFAFGALREAAIQEKASLAQQNLKLEALRQEEEQSKVEEESRQAAMSHRRHTAACLFSNLLQRWLLRQFSVFGRLHLQQRFTRENELAMQFLNMSLKGQRDDWSEVVRLRKKYVAIVLNKIYRRHILTVFTRLQVNANEGQLHKAMLVSKVVAILRNLETGEDRSVAKVVGQWKSWADLERRRQRMLMVIIQRQLVRAWRHGGRRWQAVTLGLSMRDHLVIEKIGAAVYKVNLRHVGWACLALLASARLREVRTNDQHLANLQGANLILEEAFDANPYERACHQLVTRLQGIAIKRKRESMSRLKSNVVTVHYNKRNTTAAVQNLNNVVLKRLDVWFTNDDKRQRLARRETDLKGLVQRMIMGKDKLNSKQLAALALAGVLQPISKQYELKSWRLFCFQVLHRENYYLKRGALADAQIVPYTELFPGEKVVPRMGGVRVDWGADATTKPVREFIFYLQPQLNGSERHVTFIQGQRHLTASHQSHPVRRNITTAARFFRRDLQLIEA